MKELEMKRLFILGNGFDMFHGLKTSYENFKKYLLEKYMYTPTLPNIIPLKREQEISLIVDLLDKTSGDGWWKDIERNLGNIEISFESYMENVDYDTQRLYILILCNCLEQIPHIFSEWVDTIRIENAKKNPYFANLFDSSTNAYLTFNYTTVLEDIYNVTNNLCHIHGIQHDNKIFGHGKTLTPEKEYWLREDLEAGIVHTWLKLKKDTSTLIKRHCDFFEQLSVLEEIYSYGFSFSDPDIPYIKEICKRTDSNTIWYLSSYEEEFVRNQYKYIIRDAGFKGKFRMFDIN